MELRCHRPLLARPADAPNLRPRWHENISIGFNIASRLGFMPLLVAALSIHAFVFNPICLIPPVIAALLNLRLALAMKDKSASDILYAALAIPALHVTSSPPGYSSSP